MPLHRTPYQDITAAMWWLGRKVELDLGCQVRVGGGWEVVRSCQQVVSRENVRRECCYLIIPTQSNTALGGDSMWVWVPSVRKGQVRTNIYIATSSHIKHGEFKNMEDENSELPLKRTLWWINPIFGGYCQLLSQPGSQTRSYYQLESSAWPRRGPVRQE